MKTGLPLGNVRFDPSIVNVAYFFPAFCVLGIPMTRLFPFSRSKAFPPGLDGCHGWPLVPGGPGLCALPREEQVLLLCYVALRDQEEHEMHLSQGL